MALYGITHVPTGNLVRVEFFEQRVHLTLEEDLASFVKNSDDTVEDDEGRPLSVYGFFLDDQFIFNKEHACTLAVNNPKLLSKIISSREFKEHAVMDIYGFKDYDSVVEEFGKRIPFPTESEFEITELPEATRSSHEFYDNIPLADGEEEEND